MFLTRSGAKASNTSGIVCIASQHPAKNVSMTRFGHHAPFWLEYSSADARQLVRMISQI